MKDEKMFMMKARYDHLMALPILNLRELEERDDLMFRLEPDRFNREFEAWGNR